MSVWSKLTVFRSLYLLPSLRTGVIGDTGVQEIQSRPGFVRCLFKEKSCVANPDDASRTNLRNVGNWLCTGAADNPRKLHCTAMIEFSLCTPVVSELRNGCDDSVHINITIIIIIIIV
jgi:hypothetical protein